MNAQVSSARIVDDPRWARVVARDRGAEGFVLSVATTGVYCRCGCPARLPLPKNVGFHATPAEAERLGFRPCKRCKPDQPRGAGQGAGGADIRFAVGRCKLGAVLVARSAEGVCAILIGDEAGGLVRELRQWAPRATPAADDIGLDAVLAFLDAPARGLDLPLDPRGTAFQRRVWRALPEIPAGRTASYAEVARRVGAPRSVRAVAGACAANRIAVAIPCHRVVRADGTPSGYRWGVARQRALLDRERGR